MREREDKWRMMASIMDSALPAKFGSQCLVLVLFSNGPVICPYQLTSCSVNQVNPPLPLSIIIKGWKMSL